MSDSGLTYFQRKWCISVMDKMGKIHTSKPFEAKPSQDTQLGQRFADLCPEAIDLNTVRERLQQKRYNSVIEWGLDVRKVFWCWISFYQNEAQHPVAQMARDLQEWFEKKFNSYPRDRNEQWMMKLEKARRKCEKLIKTAPPMKLPDEYYKCPTPAPV